MQAAWLRQAPASKQVIKPTLKETGRLNLVAGSLRVCAIILFCLRRMLLRHVIISPVDRVMSRSVDVVPLDLYASGFVDITPWEPVFWNAL